MAYKNKLIERGNDMRYLILFITFSLFIAGCSESIVTTDRNVVILEEGQLFRVPADGRFLKQEYLDMVDYQIRQWRAFEKDMNDN